MGRLFGTDGVRGVANSHPMDVETAMSIGRAAARYFKKHAVDGNGVMIVGQDTRLSGDMIAQAVGAGICSAGLHVRFLGVIPTPAVAYLAAAAGAAAGVVISASHNPFEDNGIKLFDGKGYKLDDQAEDEIEGLMQAQQNVALPPQNIGRIHQAGDVAGQYLAFLEKAVPELDISGINMVVDCSNGAAYKIAPQLFRRMGANVTPIHCSPDGTNINERCGSQHPQSLARQVIAQRADVGLAFDGDGDRMIAVDEKGAVLTGDQVMAICAEDLKKKGILKNNRVVCTVMSNMGFHQAIKSMGLELFTTPVGDRYVMQEMLARDAVLGGEDSGHMIFRDRHTTGDGIMAALRLLDAMVSSAKPLSELSRVMTVFPQVLINVPVLSKPDLDTIIEIQQAIKSVEDELSDKGRVLVRYSGTQPQCRVMVEGPDEAITRRTCGHIARVVQDCLG